MITILGLFGLVIAFFGAIFSLGMLSLGLFGQKSSQEKREEKIAWGAILSFGTCVALTFCCGVLVYCFLSGDISLEYVVSERSTATGSDAWLYKLAGLWGGREGSLLLWAWLISVFNALVAHKVYRHPEQRLDASALLVAQGVLTAFVCVLLFSADNMPFTALDSKYISDGELVGAAATWGMNALLEHWAMAIHPPTLFIGYAGFTLPFAYAIATLICNNATDEWIRKSQTYTVVSWLFLSIGIGLGAVWAYVVLGWGGYWGWDPVENASLLPWLVGLALIHSFTVYRQRGAFKRWAVFCACLSFAFVILGTFITRSGLVESVHAFEGDPVSLVLFLILIIVSLVAGIVGIALRWKNFCADTPDGDDMESVFSKETAYYVNNLIIILFAVLLAYLTISSALPEWLPYGGMSVSTGTFEGIARPLGIVYLLLVAVCPLLSWGHTEGKTFLRRAWMPGLFAGALFVGLMVVFFTQLAPVYEAVVAEGGTTATNFTDYGPQWYYYLLTILGFLVASLLFFNSLLMLGKFCKGLKKGAIRNRLASLGGMLSHTAMGIILIGLIGSAMYVNEKTFYIECDTDNDFAVSEDIVMDEYTLVFDKMDTEREGSDYQYSTVFTVYRNGVEAGTVNPSMEIDSVTMEQKLNASTLTFLDEDLFVVFQGLSTSSDSTALVMNIRVNPLIFFVWVGFVLLVSGIVLAAFARRSYDKIQPVQEAVLPTAQQHVDAEEIKEV